MPRVIFGANAPPPATEILAQRLADELTTPGDQPQPLIIERHLRGTKSRHIWVIWERWTSIDPEERTAVITDAYSRAEGIDAADNITIALGVLPQDAVVLGLLPFATKPVLAEFEERTDYRRAKMQEGRNTIFGENARELRYPSIDQAKQAIDRLKLIAPRTEWVIRTDEDGDEED